MNLFNDGWEVLRERIFENQKRLGVIPANAQLTPWPDDMPRWDSLSADEKRLFIRQVEVYAAYLAYTDHEIGRVIAEVERLGQLDNTLIIYISGDNGSSAEGSLNGTPNEVMYFNGVALTRRAADAAASTPGAATGPTTTWRCRWTWAFGTPYRWTKQVASPFRRHAQRHGDLLAARIADRGGIRTQFHHVIDVVPTILDAIGIPQPNMVNGIAQRADGRHQHGLHLPDKANADAPSTRRPSISRSWATAPSTMTAGSPARRRPRRPGTRSRRVPTDVMNGYEWELYNLARRPDAVERPRRAAARTACA